MSDDNRRSLLDAEHRLLGGKMVPFGGWDMPLEYQGVLMEHRACRAAAVVFDVSHLGSVRVEGPGAFAALQNLLTNDLRKIAPGQAQYTHLLDERDAHVVDDIIVWWVAEQDFLVIPNASNTAPALALLRESAAASEGGAEVEDVTSERALLAVQGPQARAVLSKAFPGLPGVAGVAHFGVSAFEFDGSSCMVGGTGYTGEDGVELFLPAAVAGKAWHALVEAGAQPAGLGSRDTLRLEMGYPLHGHELGPGITPLQAGLGWVVSWDKETFRGRAVLEAERQSGVTRRLRGVRCSTRQIPRAGHRVLDAGGGLLGEVVSGNFSPTLECGIAMAFLPPDTPVGADVQLDIRGRLVPAQIVQPPFIPR